MAQTIIITNQDDVSIDYLIAKLEDAGMSHLRINSEDTNHFEFNIAPGEKFQCIFNEKEFDLKLARSVLFRRIPLKYNEGEEGEDHKYLNLERKHFLEGLYLSLDHCKWVNPMFGTQIAERKIYQLQVAQTIGFSVPKSIVTNSRFTALSFLKPLKAAIIKPISNGLQVTKENVFSIYTTEVTHKSFSELPLSPIFDTPVYLQEKIDNSGDIRVTIIGNSIFAVKITKQGNEVDWRKPEVIKTYGITKLPVKLENQLINLNAAFKLVYSAIDLILMPSGEYIFLEINPVGEWVWLEQELGIDIASKIISELR